MNATANLTEMENAVLTALKAHIENIDGDFGSVYLDNCRRDLTPHQFAGVLGSLAAKGLYRDECGEYKGVFGLVRI